MNSDQVTEMRRWYADEISWASGVSRQSIVDAFARVPREDFLPPGPWRFSTAMIPEPFRVTPNAELHHLYHNVMIALDTRRDLNTALPSYMAAVLDIADIKPGERIGHLGAGLGYYSAIIAEIVGASGSVVAIEIDQLLASQAASNLKQYSTARCLCANGSYHSFSPRSLDALVICAGASIIQRSWLESLCDGGRIVVPLCFCDSEPGQLARITRLANRFRIEFLMDTLVYPCLGSHDLYHANLLKEAVERYGWYTNAELRLDVENADESAWLVTPTCWISMLEWNLTAD